jgi:hypothetical protein
MKSWMISHKHIAKQKVFNPPKIKQLNKVLFWSTKSEVLHVIPWITDSTTEQNIALIAE